MTLQEFRDVLLRVTEKVYHFEAFQEATGQYIVWQETGGSALNASGRHEERVKRIQVDFFTDKEFDPMLERLLEVLEAEDIAYEEPVVDYEREPGMETGIVRYIIECEVV